MIIRTASLPPEKVTWGVVVSSAGKLAVGLTEKGEVCRISFFRERKANEILAEWQTQWPQTKFVRGAALEDLAAKPALLVGTEFQHTVWRVIAKIRTGRVMTYSEIAQRIGKSKAYRAVGAACGANPVPYLVPCHRVVASNGGLGGFSGGLDIKQALLKAEGFYA